MKKVTTGRVLACLLALTGATSSPAQGQVWDFLGDAQINGSQDHEKLEVARRNAAVHTIQLRVSGDAIFFDRLVVHFADGTSEEMTFQGRIWPGGRNRTFGLSGERRAIESLELWYYKELWKHNPRVILYGS